MQPENIDVTPKGQELIARFRADAADLDSEAFIDLTLELQEHVPVEELPRDLLKDFIQLTAVKVPDLLPVVKKFLPKALA